MPADAREYWRTVTNRVMALWDGGGGGMKAASAAAGRGAEREMRLAGACEADVRTAGAAQRRQIQEQLRAGTTHPCTKEHLHQTGEYQLQDGQLSEPFEVNLAFVMNAYMGLARQTGCRPGMAVNDRTDAADKESHWHELPPLRIGDLAISPDALLERLETVVCDGGFEASLRAEARWSSNGRRENILRATTLEPGLLQTPTRWFGLAF